MQIPFHDAHEKLVAENAAMREALERVAYEPKMTWETVREIARAVLDKIKGEGKDGQ